MHRRKIRRQNGILDATLKLRLLTESKADRVRRTSALEEVYSNAP